MNTEQQDIADSDLAAPMLRDAILERLKKACSLQQKEVPNQTALVWRADLSWLLGQFAWREAGHLRATQKISELLKGSALAEQALQEKQDRCYHEWSHAEGIRRCELCGIEG